MVEHSTHKAGVVGPIPTPATKKYIYILWVVSVARLNASPCHGEDHGFESHTTR